MRKPTAALFTVADVMTQKFRKIAALHAHCVRKIPQMALVSMATRPVHAPLRTSLTSATGAVTVVKRVKST